MRLSNASSWALYSWALFHSRSSEISPQGFFIFLFGVEAVVVEVDEEEG